VKDWQQRLYDSYVTTGQARFRDDLLHFENPYYDKIITEHLPKQFDLSILDLACGHGRLIYSLKKHGYRNLLGIDISEEQVAAAHKYGLDEVICQDIKTFVENTPGNSYDVIFLIDILEHLEKQEVFDLLDNVNRLLTDKGIVVIHVPNGAGLFGMRVRYGDFTHQNAFTSNSIRQILQACHFASINAYEDKPTMHGLKSSVRFVLWQLLTFPLRLLLMAETGLTKHILSQNMLVVARKEPAAE